jgi:type IV pilus assembly protein PilE
MDRKSFGFSLIELMIVVAVIGALMAIALPSYEGYRVRSSRAAAQAVLLEIYARQESFAQKERRYASLGGTYAVEKWYATDIAVINDLMGPDFIPPDVATQYVLTIPKVDIAGISGVSGLAGLEGYEVRATPAAGSRQKAAKEGTLVINQFGLKTIRETDDTVRSFW